jgi:hypothetical protein
MPQAHGQVFSIQVTGNSAVLTTSFAPVTVDVRQGGGFLALSVAACLTGESLDFDYDGTGTVIGITGHVAPTVAPKPKPLS